MSKLDTRVIQVTNVAPTTTKEQLKTLFQFIGRIRDCKLFPPEGSDQQVAAKVCYVEFEDSTAAGVALHLTNTVFIDRALIVVPVMDGKIPDEKVAMQLTPQTVARMAPGQPSWPTNVVSQLTGTGIDQVITTYDPRLNALGLPQYPPLPPTLDAGKVEEVRRTVYVGNLDPKTTPESLISFFSQAGEVKYVRMAGEDTSIARAAYLELTDQRSVANYLGYNGVLYNGRPITVSHAKSSINKPLTKSQEASRREVEEAMKKVQEAQALISAAAAEKFVTRSRSRSRRRSRSRSRSRSKRRSRSRSRGRRRRSRSRSRRKSRSPRRIRRSRSRSPRRRRSRSRSGFVVIPARELGSRLPRRRRSRSTSRPRRRSRSRSKRRSRTPPRAYSGRHSRSRSKGPRRKSRSRTPRRSRSRSRGKGKDKKEKAKESEKKKKEKKASRSRSLSPPTLQREGSTAGHSGDDRSPGRLDPSAKEDSGKQSQTETVSQAALPQGAKKTRSEAANEKKSSQKRDRSESPTAGRRAKSVSRSPVRGSRRRSVSRSPVKSSRRRSVSPRKRRSKSRSPRRSRSPAKKKKARSPRRSRSGSRHRSKKDKKKERSRSKERKEKKKKNKDKKEEKEKGAASSSSKAVTRNYDEEEKGFNSASDREEEMRSQKDEYEDDRRSGGADRQLVDMDTSD